MRTLHMLLLSGALLGGLTHPLMAEEVAEASKRPLGAGEQPVVATDDMIAVEEPLSPEEIEAAQQAAIQLATVNEAGEVVLPRIKTTRTVLIPKADYFAPPTTILGDAKRYVHYFCECWKAGELERMYYAMAPEFRAKVPYATFVKRFEDHRANTGGLSDESIKEDVTEAAQGIELTVTLSFNWRKVPARTVKALIVRTPNGYRLEESGIIPLTY